MANPPKLGEFAIIERFFAPLARDDLGALGLRDDAAVLDTRADERLAVTTDALVAGVHFLPKDAPDLIARKLLRVNLSDLAAMGSAPLAYTISLALPEDVDENWLEGFAAGLRQDQEAFGIGLVGGDTVATPGALTMSLTAIGRVAREGPLTRAGAGLDEDVYVSGAIGDAFLGLSVLRRRLRVGERRHRDQLVRRYRLPEPRLSLGAGLVGCATACIDISDGLIGDLAKLCRASGIGADVEAHRIPLSPAARAAVTDDQRLLVSVLSGGDDYELAFTAPPAAARRIKDLAGRLGVRVTRFGRTSRPAGVRVTDSTGGVMEVPDAGYQHFRDG